MTDQELKRLLSPHIPALEAYMPGEQPQEGGFVKLNTNENPYPPSPKAVEAAKETAAENLRLYPDPVATPLREAAARRFGLSPENVLAGNGSDELLTLCMRCFVPAGTGVVVYPEPTYVLYRTLAAIQDAQVKAVPFPRDYTLPDELSEVEGNLLFMANPNSPSGSWVPPESIRKLAETFSGVVVADEAYAEFAPETVAPLIRELPNLIVLRSFSKSHSLAGLRAGLALGNAGLIQALRKVQDSYPLDRIAIAAAAAALDDNEWTQANIEKIKATRERVTTALCEMGLEVLPSHANFILARVTAPPAGGVYQQLKGRKILVRYFDEPGLNDALRITIGTDDECDGLLGALKQILKT